MTDDVRKLLAGYATGTLTEAERQALFTAALDDPELFGELANEEPLRDLLSAPAARTDLLNRIEGRRPPLRERFALWLRRPRVMASFATAAVAVAVISVIPFWTAQQQPVPVTAKLEPRYVRPTPAAPATTPQPEKEKKAAEPPAQPRRREEARQFTPPATVTPSEKSEDVAANLPEVKLAAVAPATPAPVGEQLSVGRIEAPPAAALNAVRDEADSGETVLPYALLRRDSVGHFVPVDARSTLGEGAVVKLRFEPKEPGILAVQELAQPPLFSQHVRKDQHVELGPFEMTRDRRIQVAFTPDVPVALGFAESSLARAAKTSMPSAPKAGPQKAAHTYEILLRRK